MKKELVVKRIIQGVALCIGAVGATWIYFGLHFLTSGLVKQDTTGSFFFITPAFIIFGGIAVAIAVQNIRSFGADSIKSVIFVISFMLYGAISGSLLQYKDVDWPLELKLATSLLPLILISLLYKLSSKTLIRTTGYEVKVLLKSELETLINNQNISTASKKVICRAMPWKNASKGVGYLFIAAGWFLILSLLFFISAQVWVFTTFADAFHSLSTGLIQTFTHIDCDWPQPSCLDLLDTKNVVPIYLGFFFFGYATGKAGAIRLEKIALAKAFVEMLEKNSNPPIET